MLVSSISKISYCCIRDLGMNTALYKKTYGTDAICSNPIVSLKKNILMLNLACGPHFLEENIFCVRNVYWSFICFILIIMFDRLFLVMIYILEIAVLLNSCFYDELKLKRENNNVWGLH